MSVFEYKVVPAPLRGVKAKGVKGTAARFAHALEIVINDMAAAGWEYQRTDTLPVEERQGLTGKTTTFQNMLVFRKPATEKTEAVAGLIEDQTQPEPDDVAKDPEDDIAGDNTETAEPASDDADIEDKGTTPSDTDDK